MLYNVQEYFIWSILYSLRPIKENEKNDFNKNRMINLNFLYSLFKYSYENKINIFKLNKNELELILISQLSKTKLQEEKKEKHLNIFLKKMENLKLQVEKEMNLCKNHDIKYITYEDENYLARLKKLENPPFIIFYKGYLPNEEELKNSLAIIGSRETVQYSEETARKSGEILSKNNIWNISGLALGCDSFGHEGSIIGGGKTGAVLSLGLTDIYPKKNKKLADKILKNGGFLLSEYCPSAQNSKEFLVERDRLQSALTDGVFVIQCGLKSGTVHAVITAIELKKKIFIWKPINKEKIPKEEIELFKGNEALIENEFYKFDNKKLGKVKLYKTIAITNKNQLLELNIATTEKKEIPSFENISFEF